MKLNTFLINKQIKYHKWRGETKVEIIEAARDHKKPIRPNNATHGEAPAFDVLADLLQESKNFTRNNSTDVNPITSLSDVLQVRRRVNFKGGGVARFIIQFEAKLFICYCFRKVLTL